MFPLLQRGENAAPKFRLESFNLTNTPHFNNPYGDLANGNFNKV